MKLQGVVTVPTTQQQVWELVLDPLQLCKVIPGCEKARKVDETHYEAVLAVKVQFMTIRSKATGSILQAEEPHLLVGRVDRRTPGDGRSLSRACNIGAGAGCRGG